MVSRLKELRAEARADEATHRAFEITVGATLESADDLREWESTGVTRVIVAPWARSSQALTSLAELADALARNSADDGAEQ
jgi:hypothetical protein